MKKSEYREYLHSDHWRELRRELLGEISNCERCRVPRWLSELVYDQDLHLHHKTYKNIGREEWEDLEVLCPRCHDIETFGRSQLREFPRCEICKGPNWNKRSEWCPICDVTFGTPYLVHLANITHPYCPKTFGQIMREASDGWF
jgi:hypothetical protein